jgi:hypothetical protein
MAATWSFDHSAIYRDLYLCLVIANDLSLGIWFTRIDQKVTLMQLAHQFNSYNLMHNQEAQSRYKDKQNSRIVVRCTGVCFDHNNVSIITTWRLWTFKHSFDLLRLNFRFWLHVIYPYMHKYEPKLKCAMHEMQNATWCMKQEYSTHFNL